MPRWTKHRATGLQLTIENVRMNADHASRIAVAVLEEWNPRKGLTAEEVETLTDCLTDAKIQLDMALEELAKGAE